MRGNPVRKTAVISLSGTILIAILGLLAYIPGLILLGSVCPQYIPMAPSTAFFFIFLGVLFITDAGKIRRRQGYIYAAGAVLISAFGLLKSAEYCFGVQKSFEELIIVPKAKLGEIPIGIMSPATGFLFFLSGIAAIAYLFNNLNKQKKRFLGHLAGVFALLVFNISLIFIFSYTYGAPMLYGAGRVVPMAITTAFAFLFLGVGQIFTFGTGYFPLMFVSGSSTRAKLMRTFIPLVSIAVLFVDIMHNLPLGRFIQHFSPLVTATIVILFAIVSGLIAMRIGETVGKSIEYAEAERARLRMELIHSAKLASIGQLSSSLTHGLSGPLTGLLNLVESYRDKSGPGSKEYEDFNIMLDGIQHMIEIVKQMGAFTRKAEGIYAELSLNEVIKSTLDFFRAQLFKNNIELTENYSEDLAKTKGDKNQLQQVILNMVTNASDAMPEGGNLVISTRNSEDGANVIIEFADTGIGIAKEDICKIFKPFFTTKEPDKGTGLGLSISRRIIADHKGTICVRSEPGKGAKFTILLPVAKKGEKDG